MMLIPGPVDVPVSVLKASAYVVNHRSKEFRSVVQKSEEYLKKFGNAEAAAITTGSGTTAVESMVFSMTSPGDHVIAVSFGEFGNRLIESLRRRSLHVTKIIKTADDVLLPEEIEDAFRKDIKSKSVFLVQNETGNGTSIRNLQEIAIRSKNIGLNVYVDAVSSFGSVPIKVNEWGIDAVATCSQKGLASVPGLGIVLFGSDALSTVKPRKDIPQYLDLGMSLEFMSKHETPYTPSTGSFRALLQALEILEAEGLQARWDRHSANARVLRNKLSASGASILGNEKNFSDTVIAFRPKLPVSATIEQLAERGIMVSKGMGNLASEIIRLGNLGIVSSSQLTEFLNAYFDISHIDIRVSESDFPKESHMDDDLLR